MTTPAGATVKTAPGSRPPIRRTPKGQTYAQGRPRPPQSSTPARTGGRTQQGTSGGRRASTAGPARPASQRQSGQRQPSRRGQSPYRQVRAQYRQHVTTNYEKVIVAEFVIVVLLVAVAPMTRKERTGLSPYYGQDLVQLVAIMAAYFILGLIAQGGHSAARIAAWFGGLLALGIGLGEAAYLAKVFDLFGAVQPKQAAAGEGAVGGPAGEAGAGSALQLSESQGPQDAGAAPTQTGA